MNRSHAARVLMVALAAVCWAGVENLMAQEVSSGAYASRADLETLLATGKRGNTSLSDRERQMVRQRLEQGDFREGDRLLLVVRNDTALSDTFAVKAGQMLVLPGMTPLAMRGVLRSEAREKLLTHLSQYLRSPEIEVDPLIRVGLLGSVARPGYYSVRPDMPFSEVLMVAGGLTPDANLKKTTTTRSNQELLGADQVRSAMQSGLSLDQVGLQGGDEINVGRRGAGFGSTVGIIGALAAVALAAVGLASAL